jgi:putative heme-binding domain-containing protein
MRRTSLLFLALLLATPLLPLGSQPPKDKYAEHIAQTAPRTPQEEQKLFHLPPGFEIQLVACEPEILKPINIAFDAKGRLWVTQSVEYPDPIKGDKPSRDTLKILDDIQPNGWAKKVTTFADNLNIPIGVLPLGTGKEALVYSIPNVWRVSDTKGEGKADKKDPVLTKYGFADTHGMTGEFQMGFDGWVYACHGYSNTSTVSASDGSKVTMSSGNTYRFKPDGSHVEQWTHGQVNPFGLSFDPLGNLFSCDCHTRPVMQLLRGGWYPSFARPHDGLGFAPEMMTHDHGSTAIAGITYYAADHFPPEYRDNVFVGNVVTNRINRDTLERHGSTYKAIEMPDFVKCDDPWFRPVDIKLGPDGALYVADFYTRIIGHYEVPLNHPLRDNKHGRIWRIVYKGDGGKMGKEKMGTPLGKLYDYTAFNTKQLLTALADPNLTVRMTATHLLAGRDTQDVAPLATLLLQTSTTGVQKAHLMWVLERHGKLDDAELKVAAQDGDPLVRVHALRILTDRKELNATHKTLVRAGLHDKDAFVRRCAVEALGTHAAAENLAPLLEVRHTVPADDTHLLHATRIALREQLKSEAVWKWLDANPPTMKDLGALADVATGVHTSRAAALLLERLKTKLDSAGVEAKYAHHVARHGTEAMQDELVAFIQTGRANDLARQLELFKAVQKGTQESGKALSKSAAALGDSIAGKLLGSSSMEAVRAGIELTGTLKLVDRELALQLWLGNGSAATDVRKAAAAALTSLHPTKHIPALAQVVADANEPAALREQIALVLAGSNQAAAHDALLKVLPTAPAKLETAIATGLAGSKQGAEKLLDAVAAGKASPRLLLDPGVSNKLRQTKLPDLDAKIAKLTKGLPSADASLAKLIEARRQAFVNGKADPAKGKLLFEVHCATCHQIANKGSKIGPQLDGVGIRGLDRLLEDILDPSRNVDQAFRTTSLTLKDGKIVSGLFLREEGAILVLADQQGKEQRVQKDQVDTRTTLQLSPMPANFGELGEADLVHLLGYLLEQRVKD